MKAARITSPFCLVGREGALERRRTKIGTSGEERRRRQRLKIRSLEAGRGASLRQQVERFLPDVSRECRSTGVKRVGDGVVDRRYRVAHWRRCYLRAALSHAANRWPIATRVVAAAGPWLRPLQGSRGPHRSQPVAADE